MVGPHGHSWPSIHWWLSLTAADQGAWISGVGAFAAATAALWIALNDSRRRDRERESRSLILAGRLLSCVGLIRGSADNAIICMDAAIANAPNPQHVYGAFCTASRGVFGMKTKEFTKVFPMLVDFPARFGVTLATVPMIVEALRYTMEHEIADYNTNRLSIGDLVEAAVRTKAQLEILSSNLAAFLRFYEPKFLG